MAYCFKDDKSKVSILDAVYPVGSIYMSVNSTSPNTLFGGGTWEQINGRFLVAQGNNGQSGNAALNLSAGATGGETNHTLSVSEMPSHAHDAPTSAGYSMNFVTKIRGEGSLGTTASYVGEGTLQPNVSPIAAINATKTPVGEAISTEYKGNSSSHNNLPPYLAVYMWKRTA